MSRSKTIAALLIMSAACAGTARAERLGAKGWRWTSWNARTAVHAPVTASPEPIPAAAPAAPVPIVAPADPVGTLTGRFAVTNPNPTQSQLPSFSDPVPSPVVYTAPAQDFASSAPAPTPTPVPTADAYINFGGGPYPDASLMTTGNAQPWYLSPVVSKVFGGTPDARQQADFTNSVLNDVRAVYERSGLHNLTFTTDPNVQATHTMSVVSGLVYADNPNVIGITNVGQSGVSLIDKLTSASTPSELAVAVANNVSHELMHAFGVADHPDHSGSHIDAADATWQTLTDPNAVLSSEAVQAILAQEPSNGLTAFGAEALSGAGIALETLAPTAVPEPSTVILWTLAGVAGLVAHRRRARAAA